MFRFVVLLILSAVTIPVFAERTVVTRAPYYNHYNHCYTPQAYYGGDYFPPSRFQRKNSSAFSDINNLEKYAFNKNFTRDSDIKRVERLETLAFGAIQEGDIFTRYDNVRGAILSRPKQNYKTSLLRNISDYFSGQLTGFTPQLNNSSANDIYSFPSGYDSSSYTEFATPYGRGYRMNNQQYGTGSRVQILD